MEILSKEQLRELYQQIRENPYLIRYLNEEQTIKLINEVVGGLKRFEKEHPESFYELSFYKEHYSLAEELENHINKITQPEQVTIIDKIYLIHFYNQFKSYFPDETKESWLQRFIYPCQTSIDPIKIESKVKGENNRLILLTILDAVWEFPHPDFIYNDFVLRRFGIRNFQKAKCDWKESSEYKENLKICRQILKI
jgi:curved DNA-binding protein CbpA